MKIHIGKAHETDSDLEILRDNEIQEQIYLTLTPPKGSGNKASFLDSTCMKLYQMNLQQHVKNHLTLCLRSLHTDSAMKFTQNG